MVVPYLILNEPVITSSRSSNRCLYGSANKNRYVCPGTLFVKWNGSHVHLACLKFVIAWPIAKLLEFALGPHHGIVYRRDGKYIIEIIRGALGTHHSQYRAQGTNQYACGCEPARW